MSLPSPSPYFKTPGNIPPRQLSPSEQQAWDAPYMALAQKSNGDLRLLLHSFFSFLYRKTDFYMAHNPLDEDVSVNMGFKEGDAEKLLLASFRQFPLRRMPRIDDIRSQQQQQQQQTKEKKIADEKKNFTQNKSESDTNNNSNRNLNDATSNQSEIKKDQTSDIISTPNNADLKQNTATRTFTRKSSSDDEIRYSKEGKQIPIGNGGTYFDYNFKWTQTIQEVTAALPLPPNIRAKELDVIIKQNSIKIKNKTDEDEHKTSLMEGELKHPIRTDESTWTIEDSVLLLVLDKKDKTWWDTVLVTNTKRNLIDTSMIDSTSKISEYDQATQGMIRKILFDQRQERLGLPKSDEILRREHIEKLRNGDDVDYEPPTPTTGTNSVMISSDNIPPLPPGVEYIDKSNFPSKLTQAGK